MADRAQEAGAHGSEPPFDAALLDALMEAAALDVLLVTSKHNVQYMLDGYRFFMFAAMDAIGLSRYLPILVYPRGRPDLTFYVANANESFEEELGRFWVPQTVARSRGSQDAMGLALEGLAQRGLTPQAIGAELGFLPADAWQVLRNGLPRATIADCVEVLEELRAVKTDGELDFLRIASEGVVEAMAATFRALRPGLTKADMVQILRREEIARGLEFEYCLITAGQSLNRAPSDQVLEPGDILSLDSGGNYRGYIGDLCRMGIFGAPSPELEDALAEIDEIQRTACSALRAGVPGSACLQAVEAMVARPREGKLSFVAHGMGLITHEAPRLLANGPIPYPAAALNRPLKAGMVLSVETTWQHPRLGFLKLEDTAAITPTGHELFGDAARGWNRAG